MLVKIAEERGREGLDEAETEIQKAIVALYKGPKKLFFQLDFSQPSDWPNKKLKDALGESFLLAALLLRGRWGLGIAVSSHFRRPWLFV